MSTLVIEFPAFLRRSQKCKAKKCAQSSLWFLLKRQNHEEGGSLGLNFLSSLLLAFNILSDCQYLDEINHLLNAFRFRWIKKWGWFLKFLWPSQKSWFSSQSTIFQKLKFINFNFLDLISSSLPSMKIQIVGGKITEKSGVLKSKFFVKIWLAWVISNSVGHNASS